MRNGWIEYENLIRFIPYAGAISGMSRSPVKPAGGSQV